jgi:hypothetical protein
MAKIAKPEDQQRKSPSPMPGDKVAPVIAKTDFTLQQ